MTEPPCQPARLLIGDASGAGEVRRLARLIAEQMGLDETNCGRVAIVATEAATNLHKYAQQGQIILRGLIAQDNAGVEILSLDKGPGIADIARCLDDGYSTSGSPGSGLGAIRRLSSQFEIHSTINEGTVLVARIWQNPTNRLTAAGLIEVGVVSVPIAGEVVCGDSWAVGLDRGRHLVMIADGLGHGVLAAEASTEAVAAFRASLSAGTEQIIKTAHDLLRKTRGAASAVAMIDPGMSEVRFCGVGNISACILSRQMGRTASMISHNGTVGHSIRKVQEFVYPWTADSLLVMHSDGLSTHWQLDRYPGLSRQDPALIAAVLYRDFSRKHDDATILVASEKRPANP